MVFVNICFLLSPSSTHPPLSPGEPNASEQWRHSFSSWNWFGARIGNHSLKLHLHQLGVTNFRFHLGTGIAPGYYYCGFSDSGTCNTMCCLLGVGVAWSGFGAV